MKKTQKLYIAKGPKFNGIGLMLKYPIPSSFYAIFDGYRGLEVAAFVRRNATRLYF